MNLIVSKSKNSATYYIQKSFRNENGKNSARIVERLGTMKELIARFGEEDPLGQARKYVAELTAEEKESKRKVVVEYNPSLLIKKNEQRCYNGGYLFLQKVYHELGLDKICRKIEKKHRNKYDLDAILQMLLYTRILYPGSKLSSLEDAKQFIEQPEADIHQVYRALSLLAKESEDIQAAVYKNSLKLGKRDDSVVYYDCTNYYFESEEECGLRQYGHSKESRPNPIVQMGLFTDKDGIPLAFCINPDNTSETTTLKPLEDTLREKFGISKVITCTDGSLASYENRLNDHVGERAFITVQSLKKLAGHIQDWALETKGWRMVIFEKDKKPRLSEEEYDLTQLNPNEYADKLFCRERWIIEDCFRITKTEFEARPVFLQRDDRIRAHFLTCFLALILYKYLAKKVNRGGKHFSPGEIIGTLQDMNFLSIAGEGYIPTYTRTDLTNNLHGSAGFRTDTQIVSRQKMKKIINETKNIAKD